LIILGGGKSFDFLRATVFFGTSPLKAENDKICQKFGGTGPLGCAYAGIPINYCFEIDQISSEFPNANTYDNIRYLLLSKQRSKYNFHIVMFFVALYRFYLPVKCSVVAYLVS